MDSTATYVYCIAHAKTRPKETRAPAGLPAAAAPKVLDAGSSLWIVGSSVPLAVYGAEALEPALRDMQWVGDVAVAHEAVVEHFAKQKDVTVVPMKLFTMFSNEARAIEQTRSRRGDILGAVKRISGCEEWGVRITRTQGSAAAAAKERSRPASGAAFLAAKKQARDVARELARAAADSADGAFAALSALARDARRRDDVPEGAAAPPLLDAAFLVASSQRTKFKAAARRLAAAATSTGTEVTVTGPWPAYNFVQESARS